MILTDPQRNVFFCDIMTGCHPMNQSPPPELKSPPPVHKPSTSSRILPIIRLGLQLIQINALHTSHLPPIISASPFHPHHSWTTYINPPLRRVLPHSKYGAPTLLAELPLEHLLVEHIRAELFVPFGPLSVRKDDLLFGHEDDEVPAVGADAAVALGHRGDGRDVVERHLVRAAVAAESVGFGFGFGGHFVVEGKEGWEWGWEGEGGGYMRNVEFWWVGGGWW